MKMTLCSDIQAVTVTLNLNTCGNHSLWICLCLILHKSLKESKFPNRDPPHKIN